MNLQDLFEVSLGDYTKKATMNRAMSQMGAAFGSSPEQREKDLATAAKRERGLARAKVRSDKMRADAEQKAQADALASDRANLPAMQKQLQQLQTQFDPNYEYSDDYSFWSKQKGIAAQIAGLKNRIARAQA